MRYIYCVLLLFITLSCSDVKNYREVNDRDLGYIIRLNDKDEAYVEEYFNLSDERCRISIKENAIRTIAQRKSIKLEEFEAEFLLGATLLKYKVKSNIEYRVYKNSGGFYFLLAFIKCKEYNLFIIENSSREDNFYLEKIIKSSSFPISK